MKGSPPTTVPQENNSSVRGRHEPEKHVHQINPDGVLHAVDAPLLWGRVGRDVDASEEAEEGGPEGAA